MLISDTVLKHLCVCMCVCVIFLSGFGIRVMVALSNESGSAPSSAVF